MRGLLKAALVLAPALATSAAVPDRGHGPEWENERVTDQSFALISVDPKDSTSADDWNSQALSFRLDVLPSVEACGYGNVTVDGQVLPQTQEGELWIGQGSVALGSKSIAVASWSFECLEAELQLLKFKVDFVDGKALDDVGFTVLFQQAETTEIINIETTLSVPGHKAPHHSHEGPDAERPHFQHGPSPEEDRPFPHHGEHHGHGEHGHKDFGFPHHSMEDDIAELHWMRSQLLELEWMIFEKEQAIAGHAADFRDEDISKCDSLKCIIKAAVGKARGAVHHAVGSIVGDDEFEEGFPGRFPHPPNRKSHHGFKGKEFEKHGNHTRGPPKGPKGNSTHPHPPPFHKRPLPVCRFPPPPPYHGHGPPPPFPHHKPGEGPHPGPPPPFHFHHEPHPEHRGPPHSPFGHDEGGEHHDPHRGPHSPPELSPEERRPSNKHHEEGHDEEFGHPAHMKGDHRGPPMDDHHPEHMDGGHRHPGPGQHEKEQDYNRHDGPPAEFDAENFDHAPFDKDHRPESEGPENPEHGGSKDLGRPPPPGHGPEHEGEHRPKGPHDGPENRPPPPAPGHGPEHEGEHRPEGPHDGPNNRPPPPPDHMPGPPRHHRSRLMFALHVFKWSVVGFLFAILLAALHKRTCTPSKRAARQARREKRELRRAYRRAAHKNAIEKLLARMTGNGDDSDEGDDEKFEHERLISDAEDGLSTTMTEEITQLQNAASVVSDVVAATPQQTVAPTVSQPDFAHAVPSERAQLFSDDLYSEELPAYEDNDGSEMGSVVSDGFRNYTPSHSSSGSMSDILGPDTKQ